MPYRASSPGTLLEVLAAMFAGRSRKGLRRLALAGRVLVNGRCLRDPRAAVAAGDRVECLPGRGPARIGPRVMLLHEDADLIVVDKGAGILTSGGVRGRAPTVVDLVGARLARGGRRVQVFPCHRLDRDVSGLLVLARRREVAETMRSDIRKHMPSRVYVALVEGIPRRASGTIRSRLRDEADLVVRPAAGGEEGKAAVTHYRVIASGARHATVEVRLETGRKNQIRAHLAEIGHPVAGDRKYGARTDPAGRVALHAVRLRLLHPVTGKVLEFESPPPPALAGRDSRPGR